jgi:hypothetical protein
MEQNRLKKRAKILTQSLSVRNAAVWIKSLCIALSAERHHPSSILLAGVLLGMRIEVEVALLAGS